ncbi:MAG: hypothetical protein DME43_09320 [Verrucomicrobia bacterium]|nr:MAG: hypothetical protein DME43_09320 [Verrucomicrobiota bacterium]
MLARTSHASFVAKIPLLPGKAGRATAKDDASAKQSNLLAKAEWLLGLLLTAIVVSLLVARTFHAGALWRDECAVVQLAQMPTVGDIAHNFQHEAFPPLFPLIVRGYITVFGSTDAALRFFGFCVGCLVVGAFWISARLFGNNLPLLGLALLSLNTTFFVWGTTIRGYGLGSAMIVLVFGYVGSLLLRTRRRHIIAAALVCIFAVQILLYNSVLLVAIGAAVLCILLVERRSRQAIVVAAICTLALVFLLPYTPAYLRARDWNILVRGWPTSYSLWKHFEVALGNPGYSIPALWYAIAVGLIGLFTFRLYKNREAKPPSQLIWFGLLTSIFAIIGCYGFLRVLSYTTSAWYYLAFTCVIAAALATGALVLAPFADWSAITERQTNVDVAARTVAAQAAPSDLIVVVPWQFGIPFNSYYRGSAPWMTIPNISDHRVHRYNLIKAKMISTHPIDDLIEAIRTTLASRNRVWFVGGLNLPRPEEGPMILPPAPASRFQWDNRAYTASWWQQLSVFSVEHAVKVDAVPLSLPQSTRINELEQTSLALVQGWH